LLQNGCGGTQQYILEEEEVLTRLVNSP